jgi:hypothetical protein
MNNIKILFLLYIVFVGNLFLLNANNLEDKYKDFMDSSKKDSYNNVQETSSVIKKKQFKIIELEKLLNSKNYTDTQKKSLYIRYIGSRNTKLTTLNISKIISSSLPKNIKASLIKKNNQFKHTSYLSINEINTIYNWLKRNDFEEYIKELYFIGKNNNLKVNLKVKKMLEYSILDTYLIYPMLKNIKYKSSKMNLPMKKYRNIVSIKNYFFLEEKKENIFFAQNDNITLNCKNISYHKKEDSTIFWKCNLISVNNEIPGENQKELLQELTDVNTNSHKKELCIPMKDLQKKLNYMNINVGDPDGKFGHKTFFGLRQFQSHYDLKLTGDLDEETCSQLNKISFQKRINENYIAKDKKINNYQQPYNQRKTIERELYEEYKELH